MIEKAERNNQAAAQRWRSGEIGVHEHAWVPVGSDSQGDTYKQCSICDARTNVKGPRDKAQFQDWLEYRAEWGDEPGASAPEPVADDPLKTRVQVARVAEAVEKAKGAKDRDKDVEIVEPVADDQAKIAAVLAATAAATKKDEDEDEEGELPKRGPGRPRKY